MLLTFSLIRPGKLFPEQLFQVRYVKARELLRIRALGSLLDVGGETPRGMNATRNTLICAEFSQSRHA